MTKICMVWRTSYNTFNRTLQTMGSMTTIWRLKSNQVVKLLLLHVHFQIHKLHQKSMCHSLFYIQITITCSCKLSVGFPVIAYPIHARQTTTIYF